jgi:hypothetical protein
MKNHGEFKSVRSTTNHLEATDQGQQDYDGPAQCAEPSKSETATRRATSLAGDAGTLPRPVTALQELLAKVDAGEWDTKLALKALPESHVNDAHEWVDPIGWASRAFHYRDLNAAKALHEWVLPEWRVTHAFGLVAGEMAKFNLTHNEKTSTYVGGKSATPARAWLIAIIKALITQDQTT